MTNEWTPARIERLAQAVGGPVALADLLSIRYDTVYKWKQGLRNPSGPARRLMEMLEKQHGLEAME